MSCLVNLSWWATLMCLVIPDLDISAFPQNLHWSKLFGCIFPSWWKALICLVSPDLDYKDFPQNPQVIWLLRVSSSISLSFFVSIFISSRAETRSLSPYLQVRVLRCGWAEFSWPLNLRLCKSIANTKKSLNLYSKEGKGRGDAKRLDVLTAYFNQQ